MPDATNHNPINPVAESYAQALFELAQADGRLESIARELGEIDELINEHPDVAALFAHQTIDTARRGQTLRRLFEGRVDDLIMRFLLLLNDKGRLDQIAAIRSALERRLKTARGEVDVEVTAASPLTPEQLRAVGERISGMIGQRAVVHLRMDAALIGGLRIRIGDRLIDGSVATQLRRLARELRVKGHDAVRQAAPRLMEGG